MRATKRERDEISAYVEAQAEEKVVHLEKAASERVGPVRHDIWDVHCATSRWWVVTNHTNLYNQADFKSRDVVLTFHVGLMLRGSYLLERRVAVTPQSAELLPGSWRRWQQAFEAYEAGDEAENFQAVGVRLRECLVSFIGETTSEELVPRGEVPPKGADFKGWTDLLANHLAASQSNDDLRSYLKKLACETWAYVNWLTHAKNAMRMDAEIALKAVEHLLGVFSAARLRLGAQPPRCEQCGSYGVVGGTCEQCGWIDAGHEPPVVKRRRGPPKGDCVPSSDISTFLSPEDVI